MKWFYPDGTQAIKVEKQDGGTTAPTICHARKLGLIPDVNDVISVYHGSRIMSDQLTRAIDYALEYERGESQKVLARLRLDAEPRIWERTNIIGDVAEWCDGNQPQSIEGIELADFIEGLDPHSIVFDTRSVYQGWCSVKTDIFLKGCDRSAIESYGANAPCVGGRDDAHILVIPCAHDRGRHLAAIMHAAALNHNNVFINQRYVNAEEIDRGAVLLAACRELWMEEKQYQVANGRHETARI